MTTTKPQLAQELETAAETTPSAGVITIQIDSTKVTFNYKKSVDQTNKNILGYTTSNAIKLKVSSVIQTLSTEIAELLTGTGLMNQSISFKRLIVIYSKDQSGKPSKWLFALDLDLANQLQFSNLPLVGDAFQNQTSIISSLRIVASSESFTLKEVRDFNKLFPTEVSSLDKLPDPGEGKGKDDDIAIPKGFSLSGKLDFSHTSYVLNLPVSPGNAGGNTPTPTPSQSTAISKKGVWFDIEKSIGALSVKQIGFIYEKEELAILFDAALKVSAFTLTCDNLGVKLPLKNLTPSFNLDGVGVEYKSENIEIAGALLRKQKTLNGIAYDEYLGMAILKFKFAGKGDKPGKTLGLSAIGSYANYNGKPALFFYAVLDYPLGGPAFFFVTGFALGFGYNRYLKVPPINKLAEFPLVAQAVGGVAKNEVKDTSKLITQQLQNLDKYVTLSPGSGFIAIGIKFTSFKLVDCFALLTIAFGEDFEINLLGIASMKLPPLVEGEAEKTIPPVAEVTMLLRARFSLNEGVIAVEAQLSNDSYILSKNCRLTGGFAFYTWFDGPNAGDFVITLGGYHPSFKKPAHYPNVPRLGFNWQVDSCLSLKGEMYFALCSHALMVGGKLEASFRSGSLWAYFVAEAHFLISWKPYFYSIQIQVRIQAGVGILGPVNLGVQLQIWGPEFGGIVRLKIVFVKVVIEFGDQSSRFPSPINWKTFRESFLPSDQEICTIAVTQGLARQLSQADGTPLFIVNPLEFELVTNSVIPTQKGYYHDNDNTVLPDEGANTNFGARSMGIKAGDLETTHTIKITRKDGSNNDIEVKKAEWTFKPATKQIPTGLWGDARVKTMASNEYLLPPETNEQRFLENTLSGFRILPGKPPEAGNTDSIKVTKLQYDTKLISDVYAWQEILKFAVSSSLDAERITTIKNNIVDPNTINRRNQILTSLGFTPTEDVKLTNSVADAFVIAPQVKA
ncbi:hypothetical protein G7B40_031795 [Aetokthonos hydrillicola Thurmond2011]|jgi:hypothetical protein|uniref:DUF6603 domain-containing protein n=1 Tax=Aetokthonos hydrillicola Thurmond2011 TaxID=2712845 RepID=A0AAP5ICP4_9CYAN|nr:DUF6603 domain-containing protein [Aetokthonos hydrillicola]MBO3461277.1 hypothetical protein [Aetokthonos hydrillicola CCALA 1050]MBW4589616.1 hypothetical protein [Aetokthonos hydrillicola CCALA 1050]MDR9899111.1 hypothetical protein [Aetokthonos hydrillicola Thurmond2011]